MSVLFRKLVCRNRNSVPQGIRSAIQSTRGYQGPPVPESIPRGGWDAGHSWSWNQKKSQMHREGPPSGQDPPGPGLRTDSED